MCRLNITGRDLATAPGVPAVLADRIREATELLEMFRHTQHEAAARRYLDALLDLARSTECVRCLGPP